ncbi:phosphatidylinositol mannoside acyltransferase [Euzebya tangerina]|uniref:phosphatidylinositol mannoside acyltransferase n=1 Tax=Euzebya tangerina TaxID=591198 RepID=UPI000E323630|nr:phosphatidylinositol mannoside acyltransferase [Euzebya tangerina]
MSARTADPTPLVSGLPPAPRTDFGPQPDGSYTYRGSGRAGEPVDRNHGAADRVPAPRTPETTAQQVGGHLWGGLWEAARSLPGPLAFGLARSGGLTADTWASLRRGHHGAMIRRNLARVVPGPDLGDAVTRAYASYARYYMEAFRTADIDPDDLDRRTTAGGFEHLDGVLAEGRGAIILLAHHGSWDIAARWAESHGYHLACVAEVLRPRRLFRKFVTMREAIGLEIVPLRRGENLDARLKEVLAANHLVGLLSDRDLSGRAPLVDFFGEPARIPVGPARLSAATGSKIVPITMLHRPNMRYHLQVLEPFDTVGLDLADGVQRTARALEDLIRLDPAQWHAFQPIFEADRR